MEEYLKRFKAKRPRAGLKEEILNLARAEWFASKQVPVISKIISHWLSWAGAAATILICLILNTHLEQIHQEQISKLYGPTQIVVAQESEAQKLAKELVALLGDNGSFAWLQKRLELQLTQPTPKIDWVSRYRMMLELLE